LEGTAHPQSRQRRTSISELVRVAVRDRYGASQTNRRQAMKAIVGMWSDREDLSDAGAYVRQLRKGKRLKGSRLEIRPDRFGYLN
jgi:hypothetical protein